MLRIPPPPPPLCSTGRSATFCQKLAGMKNPWLKSKHRHEASFSISCSHPHVQWMCASRWTTACVHIGWTTGCVHPVGHLMSASALQPHASIRVPTASATSGGPLDVATSGGPPVAHWWSSGCNDIWWTTGCASRLCTVAKKSRGSLVMNYS